MAQYSLHSPFNQDFSKICIGDTIYISGTIYVCRDAAHKRMYDLAIEGKSLPIDIHNQAIYYAGPCPARPGNIIGPCGPTTSGRVDKFTPLFLDMGLKIMIGKGFRSGEVIESIVKNKCLYLAATGGAGALLSRCVKSSEVSAFGDLGTEAIRRFYVEDFPTIVAIDISGNNLYTEGLKKYKKI